MGLFWAYPTLLLLPQSIALESDFKERVKNANSKIFFIDLTLEDADIGVYKTDAVIIAYTGHLQQACFDYLMLQGTTLPPVIEGCNSREACESAGRPFLHGSGKHDPLKRYALEAGDTQALHADACLCLEQGDGRYISQLAQYMRASMESDPQLLAYHKQRHAAFLKRPDACEIALDTLGIPYEKKYLRSSGTAPAVSFFTSEPDLSNKKSPRIDRPCTLF